MMGWMLAHPWLTFWLGVLGLVVIDGAIANICNTIMRIYGVKKDKNNSEKTLDKDENE